jgi:hypothetical protein
MQTGEGLALLVHRLPTWDARMKASVWVLHAHEHFLEASSKMSVSKELRKRAVSATIRGEDWGHQQRVSFWAMTKQ